MNMHSPLRARRTAGLRKDFCLTIPLGFRRSLPSYWEWRGEWRIGPFRSEDDAYAWEAALRTAIQMKTNAPHQELYTLTEMVRGELKREDIAIFPGEGSSERPQYHFVLDRGKAASTDDVEFHTDPRGLSPHAFVDEFADNAAAAIRRALDQ